MVVRGRVVKAHLTELVPNPSDLVLELMLGMGFIVVKGEVAEHIKRQRDEIKGLENEVKLLENTIQNLRSALRTSQDDTKTWREAAEKQENRADYHYGTIMRLIDIVCPNTARHRGENPQLYHELDEFRRQGNSRDLSMTLTTETGLRLLEIDRLQGENQRLNDKMVEDQRKTRDSYEMSLGTLRAEKRNQKILHDKNVAGMAAKHYAVVDKLQQTHSQTVAQTKQTLLENYNTALDNLKRNHGQTVSQLEQTRREAQEQHELDVQRLQTQHAKEQNDLQQNLNNTVVRWEQTLNSTVTRMQNEHTQAAQKYHQDLRAYSEALVKRDKFEGALFDEQIKAKFAGLVKLVDDLADRIWRHDQDIWTSQALHELTDSPRILKKNILQDTIWIILYQYIFCSPFRIFGDEGKSLEDQWLLNGITPDTDPDPKLNNDIYTWPPPSIETERTRYINIEEGRKALQIFPSEHDPRHRLRAGFLASTRDLDIELQSTLSELIHWDEGSAKVVRSMTKKMISVWLEFGMQRCRIVLELRGSRVQSAGDKLEVARQQGGLKLDVTPGLVRYGNSMGFELGNKAVVIRGCEGQVVQVP